jgi:NAD(P)H-nitrite reductase large subunit
METNLPDIYACGDVAEFGRKSPEDLIYKNLYFKGDKLTGGVLIGDVKKSMSLLKALNSVSLADAITLLE